MKGIGDTMTDKEYIKLLLDELKQKQILIEHYKELLHAYRILLDTYKKE